jgi:hypothetical protein
MGSWAARKLLDVPDQAELAVSDKELARRFVLGDEETLKALRRAYTGRS